MHTPPPSPDSPLTCDVAVVGSGPAGASAARLLAAAGLRTLLLEKEPLPRYKTCGGGLTPRALHLLNSPDLPPIESACSSVHFALSDSLTFSTSRPHPLLLMTMRADFDHWLTQKALHAGTRLLSPCTLSDVSPDKEFLRLTTSHGPIHARFLIAADGANSLIARKLAWPPHPLLAPALECEVTVPPADFQRLSASARFDFHVVPTGYAWVFPKHSRLSIGVLTLNPGQANLNQYFAQYLAYLGIPTPLALERHGFLIPLAPRSPILARHGTLLTGDAAGLADPITAEGITHAILSAQLAARAIATAFPHRSQVESLYNASLHTEILHDLRLARRLAHLLYHMPKTRNALFRWQGHRLTHAMTDLISGHRTYRQLLASPTNYLKFLLPSRPQLPVF